MIEKKGKFIFRSLHKGQTEVANVFIHGYSAGHNIKDRLELARQISPDIPGSVNIFAFWKSGHILESIDSTGSFALFLRPTPLVIGGLAIKSVLQPPMHFLKKREYAELCGKTLLAELDKYLIKNHPYVERINIIGHSLGGRVAISTLRTILHSWKAMRGPLAHTDIGDLKINNVLLMGAAVEVSDAEAAALVNVVDGYIFNAFATADRILPLNLRENSIGGRAVPHFKSVSMGEKFGHLDYWPNLTEVMAASGFLSELITNSRGRPGRRFTKMSGFTPEDMEVYRTLSRSPSRLLRLLCIINDVDVGIRDPRRQARRILKRIKEIGGNTLANKYRGHGVSYAETLEDTLTALNPNEDTSHIASLDELELKLISIINHSIDFKKLPPSIRIEAMCMSSVAKKAISIYRTVNNALNASLISTSEFTPFGIKQKILFTYLNAKQSPSKIWNMKNIKLLPTFLIIAFIRQVQKP